MPSFEKGRHSERGRCGHLPPTKRKTGENYERMAASFFEQNGFEILQRNWRAGRQEIDLIVKKDNLIAFVEVKSTRSKKFGHPVERVDDKKVVNLTKAAQQYLLDNKIEGCDLRFDVVTFVNGNLEHFPRQQG
ncbi:MAG: YraN family protein [Candidatus Zixiibacteriota bacterium]